MLFDRADSARQQPRALNLSDLLRGQPRTRRNPRRPAPSRRVRLTSNPAPTHRAALLAPPHRARPAPTRAREAHTTRADHTRPRRHYRAPPQHHTPRSPSSAPANGDPGRRHSAKRRKLAAALRAQEREREREMRQAADASRYATPTGCAHPRHVSPSRNHAEQAPSSKMTRPSPPANIPIARALQRSTTQGGGPNQTLCSPGNHNQLPRPTHHRHNPAFLSSPYAKTPTRAATTDTPATTTIPSPIP